jgi:hypothetical protein
MRQFQIRPVRRVDGGLHIHIVIDPSVAQLSPDEQGRVYERAMGVALEAAKTGERSARAAASPGAPARPRTSSCPGLVPGAVPGTVPCR